jgi:hypothetical protein
MAPEISTGTRPRSQILLLIAEEVSGPGLARELADRGEGPRDASVALVAPALVPSATAAQADDIDAAITEAQRKVDASVALLRRQGYTAVGKVGDSDPVQAIEDGLAEFPSKQVIVVTHPSERMVRLERYLVDRVTRDVGADVTHVVMNPGYEQPLGLVEDVAARTPTRAEQIAQRRRGERDYLALGLAFLGTLVLGWLALIGTNETNSAVGIAQLLIAGAAFGIAVFYVIGAIAFEAAGYRGGWARLTSDFVFAIFPIAIAASVVLSVIRG